MRSIFFTLAVIFTLSSPSLIFAGYTYTGKDLQQLENIYAIINKINDIEKLNKIHKKVDVITQTTQNDRINRFFKRIYIYIQNTIIDLSIESNKDNPIQEAEILTEMTPPTQTIQAEKTINIGENTDFSRKDQHLAEQKTKKFNLQITKINQKENVKPPIYGNNDERLQLDIEITNTGPSIFEIYQGRSGNGNGYFEENKSNLQVQCTSNGTPLGFKQLLTLSMKPGEKQSISLELIKNDNHRTFLKTTSSTVISCTINGEEAVFGTFNKTKISKSFKFYYYTSYSADKYLDKEDGFPKVVVEL